MADSDDVDSLLRGLRLLELAVALGGGTAAELAAASGFTRQTVYRIANTLVSEGLFVRHAQRFAPSQQTRALSEGYSEPEWIGAHAIDPIRRVGQLIFWPLSLATFGGSHMLVRFTTDDESPYVFTPSRAGMRAMISATASGRLYLAHCDPAEAERLIALAPEGDFGDAVLIDRERMVSELGETRARGDYTLHRLDGRFYFMAVPIVVKGRFLASITIRILTSAVKPPVAATRYLPVLKALAAEIASGVEASQASASSGAVPAS